eukprot:360147-Chlamydomonas_euryale.AAC.12
MRPVYKIVVWPWRGWQRPQAWLRSKIELPVVFGSRWCQARLRAKQSFRLSARDGTRGSALSRTGHERRKGALYQRGA